MPVNSGKIGVELNADVHPPRALPDRRSEQLRVQPLERYDVVSRRGLQEEEELWSSGTCRGGGCVSRRGRPALEPSRPGRVERRVASFVYAGWV